MPLIRSASFNLFIEILVRIALMSAFCYMETMSPFVRIIHQSELETEYKYPRRESYVPGGALWSIVLSVPCVLSLLAWAGCNDCNDALEILLAWSLALGINGVITDTIKLITVSFCSLGVASAWLCGRLGVASRARGRGARVLACLAPLALAAAVALSRSCDYHHHWQDILVGSLLGYTTAIFCYRQYYNPLSSDLSGVPYIVSNYNVAKYFNGKPDISPVKDAKEVESTPLLNGGKKDDKWI